MKFTIKQLQAFAMIVKHGSVSKAAEELCISQSALSTALAELETRLKTPLFIREGRRLILNRYGTALLPKVMEVQDKINEIEKLFSKEISNDYLTIGASAAISQYLLTDIIKDYLQSMPQTKLSLTIKHPQQLIDDLKQFKLDIGFSEKYCYDPMLETIPWYEDSLAVFAASRHELARKKIITKKDLIGVPWILSEKGTGIAEIFEAKIAPHLNNIKVRMTVVHNDVIKQLVAAGLGICCLSTLILRDSPKQQGLIALNTPFIDLKRKFYILLRKNDNNSILKNFLSICLKRSNIKGIS